MTNDSINTIVKFVTFCNLTFIPSECSQVLACSRHVRRGKT